MLTVGGISPANSLSVCSGKDLCVDLKNAKCAIPEIPERFHCVYSHEAVFDSTGGGVVLKALVSTFHSRGDSGTLPWSHHQLFDISLGL